MTVSQHHRGDRIVSECSSPFRLSPSSLSLACLIDLSFMALGSLSVHFASGRSIIDTLQFILHTLIPIVIGEHTYCHYQTHVLVLYHSLPSSSDARG